MNNTTKIELAISDLAEALALSIELKLAKRFGETIGRVNERLAKVEERIADLDERASDDGADVEEKRLADYLQTAHRRIFLPLAERLATVEERTANLDERASDDSALDYLLDDYESRISTLEDEMSGVLTSDDVREILESSDLKITIS